jgi:hypothetical protein
VRHAAVAGQHGEPRRVDVDEERGELLLPRRRAKRITKSDRVGVAR